MLTGKLKFGIFEEAVHEDDEFTHDGGEGDFGGFAANPAAVKTNIITRHPKPAPPALCVWMLISKSACVSTTTERLKVSSRPCSGTFARMGMTRGAGSY